MNSLKAQSLQSLLESDRGSNDSLLAESLQLDIDELDDIEYSIPAIDFTPTLESVLNDLDGDFDDISESRFVAQTPSSLDDTFKQTSILRHVVLQGVTAQITSAADRVNAGLASSIAIKNKIAVGTSHGHILCFDNTQTLQWCCQDFIEKGAVTALSFNDDNTRLLVGFARGHIVMIDTAKGDVIRSLSDVITPNTGVLHIKWTEKPALALCSDSGGSVWYLSFTRRLGIRGCTSKCLFSGARGEVCAVEPLMFGNEEHPLKSYSIVALATLSKFFVVIIRPRLKVIKFQVMSGPGVCLPLLAWQLVLIQAADSTRTVDPVLAAGRGNQLFFHQLCYNQGRMNLLFLRKITLGYNLLALHWMGPKSMGCLDTSENLHLCEVRTNKEMECIDMAGAGLVYGSAQFKGLATGGNVSPALALAGTLACYNSIISTDAQLYVLGARSLHAVSVRAWVDRITHLAKQHRWGEAFELCIDVYRSVSDRPKRQEAAKDKILKLFNNYLISTTHCPELCLGPIISCLIEIGEVHLLWDELYERIPSKGMYLNLISDHIENDEISMISPIIAQALVDHLEKLSTKKLEDIILKLSWECLDLHQVLTISKRCKLYKSQMHLNTKALGDYVISLIELVPLIMQEDPNLGNSLLVYISSCLAGRGYPTGEIHPDIIPSVKHEVLRCLTVVHSNSASDSEPTFPYLRNLLKFNTRETLNVLALAFQEKEFNGDLGQSQRQRIVNILLEIMTPDEATWTDIGCLLNFISQQISTKSLPDDDNDLLNKIINYLSMELENESTREHSEREQAWLELITSNTITFLTISQLLDLSRKSKCYRVIEYLLDLSKNYDNILDCYLSDSTRWNEIFSYVRRHIKDPKREIRQQILANFIIIFNISPVEMTNIVVEFYFDRLKDFIAILESSDDSSLNLYRFLDNIYKNSNNQNHINELEYSELYLKLLCEHSPNSVEAFLRTNDIYKLDLALEIVKTFNLHPSLVYLYEKQGDYQSAFNLSIELLKEAPESLAENNALDLAALCSRASDILPDSQKEVIWFNLLNTILSRSDLTPITKNILHLASRHVDLQKLVQLVLNNKSNGSTQNNFGDIKHLIVGMLSNSRYETLLLQTTSHIVGRDLHNLLAKEKKSSNRGLIVKSIKCVVCRLKLYKNQNDSNVKNEVTIFGCGHAVHEDCTLNEIECPRCGLVVKDKMCLAKPTLSVGKISLDGINLESNTLNVDAPPRLGIVGRRY